MLHLSPDLIRPILTDGLFLHFIDYSTKKLFYFGFIDNSSRLTTVTTMILRATSIFRELTRKVFVFRDNCCCNLTEWFRRRLPKLRCLIESIKMRRIASLKVFDNSSLAMDRSVRSYAMIWCTNRYWYQMIEKIKHLTTNAKTKISNWLPWFSQILLTFLPTAWALNKTLH